MPSSFARETARVLVGIALLGFVAGCPRRHPPPPSRPEHPPTASTPPSTVDSSVSDVATGGSWEENGQSGIYRVVVRGGGRREMRSNVVVQWLRWDDRSEQPIEVKSATVSELSRGGIIVTASRIDQEEGKTVIKLPIANAVTGAAGEARIWPTGVGRYRARVKWANQGND
jgi:hypothetical protein